ncbi:MAG: hypothetical protein DYG86_07225 [Chloroflexi bacterium CFX2]|nr:hypothetical protein [Chloroflexi bacterium CFX2]
MNLISIWSVLEESSDILGDYAYPAMDKAAEELGLSPDYFSWVAAVNLFAPDSFTLAEFMRIFPYGLQQVNEARLVSAVEQGFLTLDGQGQYRATELGINTAVHRVFQAANESIVSLRPMPEEALNRLVNLLTRIANVALGMPEPPIQFTTSHKRRSYDRIGMRDSVPGFVGRCLEMEGYRDDAYITIWQAHRIDGHAWEVLDCLSQNDTLTFDDLHEKTNRRGVTREVHAEDVQELAKRGWVDDASGKIQITSAGRQVRAEVEAETERLFFAPWACLSESELEELASLASQLRDGLNN